MPGVCVTVCVSTYCTYLCACSVDDLARGTRVGPPRLRILWRITLLLGWCVADAQSLTPWLHRRYEICCREFSHKSNVFKDQVRRLF